MLTLTSLAAEPAKTSEAEAQEIGIEAYIYGYPLVTMDMTRAVSTNVEVPAGNQAPMGQFANMRTYPTASFNAVTAPNADTLYSVAWLDLSKEPYILHVPDEQGRYYLMPILSGWTDVIADPGTRTTGTAAADFAITGPNWKGVLPAGVKELKSPTNMVWILGRTYSSGTPEDYALVHDIQNEYSLTPLSSYGKSYTPLRGTVTPGIDTKIPVRDQVDSLTSHAFFNRLAMLLIENPPASADAPIIAKMASIGIIPGKKFQANSDQKITEALNRVPELAQERLREYAKDGIQEINGWLFSLKTGKYGTDYLQRAFITKVGLGANLPEDAIYPSTAVDNHGEALNGANKYVIHFDKGQEPPVQGFWSLTMYSDKYFFVDNPLNRYNLSSRDKFNYNPDGSLDLYIQNAFPGSDKQPNWLPAPDGNFILMIRAYWPKLPLIQGQWTPPPVQKIE